MGQVEWHEDVLEGAISFGWSSMDISGLDKVFGDSILMEFGLV